MSIIVYMMTSCFASIQSTSSLEELNRQLLAARREMESYKEENMELACKLERLSAKLVSNNKIILLIEESCFVGCVCR